MKKLTIFILVLLPVLLLAQNNDSDVDIKHLVNQQIEEARAKKQAGESQLNTKQKETNVISDTKRSETSQYQMIARKKSSTASLFTSGDFIKILVLVSASAFAFFFVLIRRKKLNENDLRNKNLKKKINMMRKEHLYIKSDKKLVRKRKRLTSLAIPSFANIKTAPKIARKLNVASGEVLLAATINHKIKTYQELYKGK